MKLPDPRGPLSAALRASLMSGGPVTDELQGLVRRAAAHAGDVLVDPDVQLTLAVCYQLHYTGFDGVDDRWEWDPALLVVRAELESAFGAAVHALAGKPRLADGESVATALRRLIDQDTSAPASTFLLRHATLDQFRDYVKQRSVYQLMEADPHSWAIPRLQGRTKAALIEIQADEYGNGRPDRMHSLLFAQLMTTLGLDPTYGAYWNDASPQMLAALNLMSWFGLQRRHRGALIGHLAVYEMTSTAPSRRMAGGLRRLGFGDDTCRYYDEHVVADALHEQVASVDLCGSFVADDPARADDVLFGAAACLAVEGRIGADLLSRWSLAAPQETVRPLTAA